jgi:HEAT repeat protein
LKAGLADETGAVRAEAVRLCTDLRDVNLRAYTKDEDPLVRAQTLAALAKSDELEPDDEALVAACDPQVPLTLRSTVAHIAREHPDRHPRAIELLSDDPHVYVRAVARDSSDSSR